MIDYPDLRRIWFDHIPVRSAKRYLGDSDVRRLFSCKVAVEEKMDGSQVGLWWANGYPHVRGRSGHVFEKDDRPAFVGLWDWVWKHCSNLEKTKRHVVFGEWLYPQHHIHYDKLPDWFTAFDIYDKQDRRFLDASEKRSLLSNWGFAQAPELCSGMLTKMNLLALVDGKKSARSSSEHMEGCVVKNSKLQMSAKYVSREFLVGVNDEPTHWMDRRTMKFNEMEAPT